MPPKKTKPVSTFLLFILLIVAFPGLRDLRLGGADCVAPPCSPADCVAGERDELTVSLVQERGADCVAPLVHLQLTVSLEIFAALTVSRSTRPHPLCSHLRVFFALICGRWSPYAYQTTSTTF